MIKWIGCILVVGSCSGAGILLAAQYRAEEENLRQLVRALDYMQCELQFRMTPLPQLCRQAAAEVRGIPREVLDNAADNLEHQQLADVASCMDASLGGIALPGRLKAALQMLGSTLGRFDLQGQLQGLEAVRAYCRTQLEEMGSYREQRLRSYQTLGLCAGAALAILLV